MNRTRFAAFAAAMLLTACGKEDAPPLYEPLPVTRRDIVVSAEAAGAVEPITVVDVKSRASGEIIELRAETGDIVQQGELLVQVDTREPRNAVTQAEADLEVARAQLTTAESQKRRTDQMHESQLVSEQEHEQATLQFANARAQLVRAERSLQTARDQMDDTNVRAPITGTIIQKSVERGQVITSATREVSGGTVLLRMADLSIVQVRTLVDETDIGKIQAGMRANITVDAYPNTPFGGTVLKIEPQSTTNQNVTMFPVLIQIPNGDGRLRPGMNAEVEIQVAQRPGVLAIPNAALRTQRDVGSAAQVLGLNPDEVMAELARADSQNPQGAQTSSLGGTAAAERPTDRRVEGSPSAPSADPATPRPGGFQLPEGVTREMLAEIRRKREAGEALTPQESVTSARVQAMRQRPQQQQGSAPTGGFQMPAGLSMEQMRPIFEKVRNQQPLTASEQALMTRFRASMGSAQGGSQRRRFGAGNSFQFGGSYIVFVLREGRPTAVRIRTGVTDLDYSEVVSGVTERDTVLLLPSASLVAAQQEMRQRFQRMGGGGVPGMQQAPTGGAAGARPATSGGGR